MITFNVQFDDEGVNVDEITEAWDAVHPIPTDTDPDWDGEGVPIAIPRFASRKEHIESILTDYLLSLNQQSIYEYDKRNSTKLTK